ncbi:MAG: HEAT repeat domain-containing protein [Saprospiraceae bacterium]|nr:HEAT repeat domain-containing protein [Saprospiraceae bacterium]
MTNEERRDKITDLLYGLLSAEEAGALKKAIDQDPEMQEEYNQIRMLVQDLRQLPLREPSLDANKRFDQWLAQQSVKSESQAWSGEIVESGNIWKYAIAASFVLAIGFFIGQEFWKENQDMVLQQKSKETLLHLVADNSTTGRIAGINRSMDMNKLDQEVKEVLLAVLENDKSTNVRLAALDALSNHIDDPEIKSKLIQLLKKDTQPIIQISIINSLVRFKEQDVKTTLEDLVDQQDLPDDVRDEAILGITRL